MGEKPEQIEEIVKKNHFLSCCDAQTFTVQVPLSTSKTDRGKNVFFGQQVKTFMQCLLKNVQNSRYGLKSITNCEVR